MPTRKQRRREAKSKRHEYEFVYVDGEGNELDDVPEELAETKPRNGSRPEKAAATAKPAKKGSTPAQRRGTREPPMPSWNRAIKRGGLLGIVVLVLFSFTAKGNLVAVIPLALLYTVLFIPFTFYIDRFAYRRWQARQQGGTGTTPAKKR
jgi:hypothetical protein